MNAHTNNQILCSNCGEDHASGQFSNCSAKLETEPSCAVLSEVSNSISISTIQRIIMEINSQFNYLVDNILLTHLHFRNARGPVPASSIMDLGPSHTSRGVSEFVPVLEIPGAGRPGRTYPQVIPSDIMSLEFGVCV